MDTDRLIQAPPRAAAGGEDHKIHSLQALRFVAALLVVWFHATNLAVHGARPPGANLDALSLGGVSGVDIFFVISGFIIATTAKGLSAPAFILRRARRILPLYFMLAAVWTLAVAFRAHLDWREMIATWLLWPATDRMTSPLIPVAWTLCFEMLFYAAFALTLWRRFMLAIIGLVFVAALSLRANPLLQYLGNPIILEFLAGVGLAHLPRWRPALLGIPVGAAVLMAGALLRWPPFGRESGFLEGHDAWLRVAHAGIPAALIVWGTLQLRARDGVLSALGDASYALYLIHVPIVGGTVLCLSLLGLPSGLVILCALAASVLLSWRVHEIVEKPVLAWLKNLTRQPFARYAGPAVAGAVTPD